MTPETLRWPEGTAQLNYRWYHPESNPTLGPTISITVLVPPNAQPEHLAWELERALLQMRAQLMNGHANGQENRSNPGAGTRD